MSDALLVHLSFPSLDAAQRCCEALVSEGLAACAQVQEGVWSFYRWEGKMCREREVTATLKTRQARFDALQSRVVELHSYDCPEIIATPIVGGHAPYLAWVQEMTQPPSEP